MSYLYLSPNDQADISDSNTTDDAVNSSISSSKMMSSSSSFDTDDDSNNHSIILQNGEEYHTIQSPQFLRQHLAQVQKGSQYRSKPITTMLTEFLNLHLYSLRNNSFQQCFQVRTITVFLFFLFIFLTILIVAHPFGFRTLSSFNHLFNQPFTHPPTSSNQLFFITKNVDSFLSSKKSISVYENYLFSSSQPKITLQSDSTTPLSQPNRFITACLPPISSIHHNHALRALLFIAKRTNRQIIIQNQQPTKIKSNTKNNHGGRFSESQFSFFNLLSDIIFSRSDINKAGVLRQQIDTTSPHYNIKKQFNQQHVRIRSQFEHDKMIYPFFHSDEAVSRSDHIDFDKLYDLGRFKDITSSQPQFLDTPPFEFLDGQCLAIRTHVCLKPLKLSMMQKSGIIFDTCHLIPHLDSYTSCQDCMFHVADNLPQFTYLRQQILRDSSDNNQNNNQNNNNKDGQTKENFLQQFFRGSYVKSLLKDEKSDKTFIDSFFDVSPSKLTTYNDSMEIQITSIKDFEHFLYRDSYDLSNIHLNSLSLTTYAVFLEEQNIIKQNLELTQLNSFVPTHTASIRAESLAIQQSLVSISLSKQQRNYLTAINNNQITAITMTTLEDGSIPSTTLPDNLVSIINTTNPTPITPNITNNEISTLPTITIDEKTTNNTITTPVNSTEIDLLPTNSTLLKPYGPVLPSSHNATNSTIYQTMPSDDIDLEIDKWDDSLFHGNNPDIENQFDDINQKDFNGEIDEIDEEDTEDYVSDDGNPQDIEDDNDIDSTIPPPPNSSKIPPSSSKTHFGVGSVCGILYNIPTKQQQVKMMKTSDDENIIKAIATWIVSHYCSVIFISSHSKNQRNDNKYNRRAFMANIHKLVGPYITSPQQQQSQDKKNNNAPPLEWMWGCDKFSLCKSNISFEYAVTSELLSALPYVLLSEEPSVQGIATNVLLHRNARKTQGLVTWLG